MIDDDIAARLEPYLAPQCLFNLRLNPVFLEDREILGPAEASPFIDLLIETRAALREAKQFPLADSIRIRLAEMGVTLEDGSGGTRWTYR